jgi:lysozyme
MDHVKGVDFCHWQANVDFSKLVANDIKFAIFKAGEIPTSSKKEFLDEKYPRNIIESKAHGVLSGAYYYFHPSISPSRQARHFDTIMDTYGRPDLPPVIDVEDIDKMKPEPIAQSLKEMIDEMVKRGYRTPIIYSRWGFLVNQVGEPFWLKDHLLWLAQYSTKLTSKPADMRNMVMWQYTDRLMLPGIKGFDGNYWLKSEAELYALANSPRPASTEQPDDPFRSERYRKMWLMFRRKEEADMIGRRSENT